MGAISNCKQGVTERYLLIHEGTGKVWATMRKRSVHAPERIGISTYQSIDAAHAYII